MKYSIADFVMEVAENNYKRFKIIAEKFRCDDLKKADLFLPVTDDDVIYEMNYCDKKYEKPNGILHASAVLRKMSDLIVGYNSFLLHSVCLDIDGTGVAFSAQSGTGKSTHLANWYAYINGEENMPEALKALRNKKSDLRIDSKNEKPKLTIVNGDKPIVRFFDKEFCNKNGLEIPQGTEFGVPYAYGTPWNGKEKLGCNMRTKLRHICFIERSETNFVTKIDKKDAVERILKQVYIPKDPTALAQTFKLVDRLINFCELWIIHCNMEPESAKIAYDAIFKNH